MIFCYNCGYQVTIATTKFCSNCGQHLSDRTTHDDSNIKSINFHYTKGDVFGVDFSGSGNIIGKNSVVDSDTINISQKELAKIPDSEYAKALKNFSETINQQLKGRQILEGLVKEINKSLDELANEVEGIKPREEKEIDHAKQIQIESKIATIIQKVLNVLPQAAETTSTFTALAPFSKLIGKGIEQLVDVILKRRNL